MFGVMADGKVLPGHHAEGLANMRFETVREMSLADIWHRSESFNRCRDTDGTTESCAFGRGSELDDGGEVERLPAFQYRRIGQV